MPTESASIWQSVPGEGLVGQCALEGNGFLLTEVPENYVKISSGLGEATPQCRRVTHYYLRGSNSSN